MTQTPELFPLRGDVLRKQLLWPWTAAAVTLLLIAAASVFAFWITFPHAGHGTKTQLRQAFSACHDGTIGHHDRTLVIDAGSGEGALRCTLGELGAPRSVITRVETHAASGMRAAEWGEFAASWTYRANNGQDLTITESGMNR
jgi:hypothetical protein